MQELYLGSRERGREGHNSEIGPVLAAPPDMASGAQK